ncbi:MAG: DUF4382 domain-containing protein [Gammaproteobacteria bacterium]
MSRSPKYFFGLVLLASFLLTACGGGSTGATGKLNLNITDAPIDKAAEVVVAFSGLSIKPADGPAFDINFEDSNGNPEIKYIDLLSLQGANSLNILDDYTLPAGHYNWIRLHVISSKNTTDSYIVIEQGGMMYPLYVPSGDETGLKLNRGFTILADRTATFTIDFDLRKSVVEPANPSTAYKLKPTLRIVENQNAGNIVGTIGNITLNDASCTGTDYAVYAFSGAGVMPDDMDGIDPDPVSSSLLTDTFSYGIGFLEQGDYTLAFTCQAADDLEDSSESISFIGAKTVTVVAGQTITEDFD